MLFWKDAEGNTRKVTAKDLQGNILRIQKTIRWVESEREEVINKIRKIDIETRVKADKYVELEGKLKDLSEQLNAMWKQEDKQRINQERTDQIRNKIDWAQMEWEQIVTELSTITPEVRAEAQKYASLKVQLQEMNETIETLQEQEKTQYDILKKYKDSKFYIPPKDLLIICGVTTLAIFVIALDRESPKIVKTVSFILKLMPLHI